MDFIDSFIDERYFKVPISQEEQDEAEINGVDIVLNLLLRSNDLESLIITMMGGDYPKNFLEYKMARNFVWGEIEKNQPDYGNSNLLRPLAIKVKKDFSDHPLHILTLWATCAVLSYALNEIDKVFEYASCVQETAYQFDNDDVLFAGAQYSFGLTMFCLKNHKIPAHNEVSPVLLARNVEASLLNKKYRATERYSKDMVTIVAALNELTAQMWLCKFDPDGSTRRMMSATTLDPIHKIAFYLDRVTRGRFDFSEWVTSFFLQ